MPPQNSDDPRPPDTTNRPPSGTRTPRKVQWHDYDSTPGAFSPTHALDEHGLNVRD
jgi:hypothetical protein